MFCPFCLSRYASFRDIATLRHCYMKNKVAIYSAKIMVNVIRTPNFVLNNEYSRFVLILKFTILNITF